MIKISKIALNSSFIISLSILCDHDLDLTFMDHVVEPGNFNKGSEYSINIIRFTIFYSKKQVQTQFE